MKPTALDVLTMNRYLGAKGLATMDNPSGLVQQLGFLVVDHEHFRQLLTRCEPEHRRDMYESLRPHLRFEPKPLDVYISEAGDLAERKQLPTVDGEGRFHEFHAPIVKDPASASLEAPIAAIVKETLSKEFLSVTCRKCTKTESFPGGTKGECVVAARDAGWVVDAFKGESFEVCPECSPVSLTRAEFNLLTAFKSQPMRTLQFYIPDYGRDLTRAQMDKQALKAARQWDADGRPVPAIN